jgi:hypothetical protein
MRDLDELRELLQGKAESLPPAGPAPRPMLRRARRRVAVTVTTGLLVLAAAAFGSYTGITALADRPLRQSPAGHSPTPSVGASAPSPSGSPVPPLLRVCAADDLTGKSELSGSPGSQVGSLRFLVSWDTQCSLTGRPTVSLVALDGTTITTQTTDADPWWKVNASTQPSGWPTTVVSKDASAVIRFAWSNGCGVPQGSHWSVELPTSGSSVSIPVDAVPGCNGPGLPITVQVGPFEPGSDATP